MNQHKILVTGAAGFIGFHSCQHLLKEGWKIIGIDNLNHYYDVKLKLDRLEQLKTYKNFEFHKVDILEREKVFNLFRTNKISHVLHLAAQAGVRYSIENPYAYVDSNVTGFLNILEACRYFPVYHLVYASSSSVYGGNKKIPFAEFDRVDTPLSIYAATKKSNELFAYAYASLCNIPTTGLRFFTVYGEWGRPDMALFMFTKNILEGKPIQVFNSGKMMRDFTYVEDIVQGIIKLLNKPYIPKPAGNNGAKKISYQLFNIGNNKPVELERFIEIIENSLGKKAVKEYLPMQKGDVWATYADIDNLAKYSGFHPYTDIEEGIGRFIKWYLSYYKVELAPTGYKKVDQAAG
jgi:UDP-glucuronate 4-epimerase